MSLETVHNFAASFFHIQHFDLAIRATDRQVFSYLVEAASVDSGVADIHCAKLANGTNVPQFDDTVRIDTRHVLTTNAEGTIVD